MSNVERLTKQDVIDSPKLGFWVHAGDFNQKIEQGQRREAELQQRLTSADELVDSLKNMLKQWMIAAHLGDVLVASHAKNITKQTADLLGLVVSDEFPQTNTSGKAHCPHDGICHASDETCADAVARVESLKPAPTAYDGFDNGTD